MLPLAVVCVVAVTLSPDAPALRPQAAPLYAPIPDGDRAEPAPRIEPGTPFDWVEDPDAGFALRVSAVPVDGADRALLTLWNWRNDAIHERPLPLPVDATVELRVAGRGTWLVTLDLLAGDRPVRRLVRSFAATDDHSAARDRWADDQFRLGVCAFPGRLNWRNGFGPAHPEALGLEATREREAELAARAGFSLMRPDVAFEWTGDDAEPDFTRLTEALDPWLRRGFDLYLQLTAPGDWALRPAYAEVTYPAWRYPKRLEPTVALNRWVLERYREQTWALELSNEPDNPDFWLGTVDEYLEQAAAVAAAAREVAPNLPLTSGSYTLIEPVETGQIAAGLRPLVDVVAYHSHGDVDDLHRAYKAMRATHAAAGYEAPVFINSEMGSAAWRLDQELVQAQTGVQKLLYCWATGHRAALLYVSRGLRGPRLVGSDYGYLDHSLCPRFLYGAVCGMVSALNGARAEGVLELGERHVLAFTRGDQRILVAYTSHRGRSRMQLDTDAARVTRIDAMGNSAPLTESEIVIDGYPTYLVLEGATRVSVR